MAQREQQLRHDSASPHMRIERRERHSWKADAPHTHARTHTHTHTHAPAQKRKRRGGREITRSAQARRWPRICAKRAKSSASCSPNPSKPTPLRPSSPASCPRTNARLRQEKNEASERHREGAQIQYTGRPLASRERRRCGFSFPTCSSALVMRLLRVPTEDEDRISA
jgi:hypothetical protein